MDSNDLQRLDDRLEELAEKIAQQGAELAALKATAAHATQQLQRLDGVLLRQLEQGSAPLLEATREELRAVRKTLDSLLLRLCSGQPPQEPPAARRSASSGEG